MDKIENIVTTLSRLANASDSQKEELRDKMRDFAHDMAIRSAFYNIAAMTLAEKNIAMGSWDLYYTHCRQFQPLPHYLQKHIHSYRRR